APAPAPAPAAGGIPGDTDRSGEGTTGFAATLSGDKRPGEATAAALNGADVPIGDTSSDHRRPDEATAAAEAGIDPHSHHQPSGESAVTRPSSSHPSPAHAPSAHAAPADAPGPKPHPAGAQFVTVEDSMGIVHASRGRVAPLSPDMRSEVAIVTGLARTVFGPGDTVPWEAFAADYDLIRDRIERVVPGFEDYNARARVPGGFALPHAPRDARVFPTATGKANFTVNPVTSPEAGPGRLLLQTLRSHDQFNTTIYGLNDRYRGIHDGRRVVLVNPEDARELGLVDGAYCDLVSEWSDGDRRATHFKIVHYPTARGCAAAYYPETNILVPLDSVAEISNTPTSKSIVIRFEPDSAPAAT
ncbi:molybdopterin dinucleotide binding domain-containing protein, partial [Glycomyces harbinensis]